MISGRDMAAYQGFLVEARRYWMSELWQSLREEYASLAAGRDVANSKDVESILSSSATYCYYAWMERHLQRMKYSGRLGLVRRYAHEQPAGADKAKNLVLDPGVPIPRYFSGVDTHQHPGNLLEGAGAGLVYKASATSTQPGATVGYVLHERFAAWLEKLGRFERVLDMGCGFGKSAITIAQRFAHAHVEGVDLSAPCLELAAVESSAAGVGNLRYVQADLRRTGYPDTSFDLVTSTMVLHEMDMPSVRDTMRESHRLLAPGGTVVHLDFRVKDPFLEFIHYGHSRRNNEPFMEPLNELDVEGEMRRAGFTEVQAIAFEEAPGATRPDWPTWRFPWTAFVGRRPAAGSEAR